MCYYPRSTEIFRKYYRNIPSKYYKIAKIFRNLPHRIEYNNILNVIFVYKLTNFTDFYDKLLKNLYDCNFTLNLVKKNDVKLP